MRPTLYLSSALVMLIWILEFFFYEAGPLIHMLLPVSVFLLLAGMALGKKLFNLDSDHPNVS